MPVPLPNLDDRRWVDLVEEGRALIPFYGSEWTDHNYHCPGITFLELLAWLTEMDVYQVNRIPESHVRKFLALVGTRLSPPRAARAVIGMSLEKSILTETLHVPLGFEFETGGQPGVKTRFRTLQALTVIPQSLVAIQVDGRDGVRDLTERWKRKEPLPLFGDDPQRGAVVYLGFEDSLPYNDDLLSNKPDRKVVPITLFFLVDGIFSSETERKRIMAANRERQEACEVPPSLLTCVDEPGLDQTETVEVVGHHSVKTVWEVFNEAGQWQEVHPVPGQEIDETRAFTLNGRVQFQLARPMKKTAIGRISRELHYLRYRLVSGAYDARPVARDVVVNGVIVEQAVPGKPISQIGLGRPYQTVQGSDAPIMESNLSVWTTSGGVQSPWTHKKDLDSSRATDRHYVVNANKGTVTFGDGRQGRVVNTKETIHVSYMHTRAEAGSVPAEVISRVAESEANQAHQGYATAKTKLKGIKNRFPAEGGQAEESVQEAIAKVFLEREVTPRAVTLADFERLAMDTPGTRIARVAAWANVHPAFPCFKAPGVITVVILPYLPVLRPFPSRGLIQAVARYLRLRRVVTTRVEVTGPTYTEVRVRARLQSQVGVNKRELAVRLEEGVNRFFHPLTGGLEKTGWSFGRDVYRSEVLQLLDEIPGVDHVLDLEFLDSQGRTLCGNVCLGRFGLIAASKHAIEVV